MYKYTEMLKLFPKRLPFLPKRFYSPLPRRVIPQPQRQRSPQFTITTPNTEKIPANEPLSRLLSEPTLVIERQIEMMNVFLGFEQANQYQIMDAMGNRIGYMLERDLGFAKAMMRQIYRLHRPFHLDVYNNYDQHVMTIKRPFSFINSHIKAILPTPNYQNSGDINRDGVVIGESVQKWHLWRRRYDLFLNGEDVYHDEKNVTQDFDQFGSIDSGFLAFDFPVFNEDGTVIGAVDRNFVGLARELFTDTGVYILRMDPMSFNGLENLYQSVADRPLSLEQRAVLLANAVSIDFDYFSRHSHSGGGFLSFGGGSYE